MKPCNTVKNDRNWSKLLSAKNKKVADLGLRVITHMTLISDPRRFQRLQKDLWRWMYIPVRCSYVLKTTTVLTTETAQLHDYQGNDNK